MSKVARKTKGRRAKAMPAITMISQSFKHSRFSRLQLVIFIAVFAAIGGYILLRSFAATTYYLSPSGNDSNPCSQAQPCLSFDKAYRTAAPGDTVVVNAGAYPATVPSEGANKINSDASKTSASDVTFTCGGGTVSVNADQLVILANHITFQGACFKLQHLWVGSGAYNQTADDVTIDGISMQAFDIAGSSNVTIRNSEVGPSVSCFASGSGACQNNATTGEQYWFNQGYGNYQYSEPKIHNCCGAEPSNVQLINNHFYYIQTRDATNAHTGCLWLESSGRPDGSILLSGNRFERCAIYDIHLEDGDGITLQNNWFGASMEPLSNTGGNPDIETSTSQSDVQWKCSTGQPDNWLVRFNTFTHGLNLDFGGCGINGSNIRVVGNILGTDSLCENGRSGFTYGYNAVVGSTCGPNSSNVGAESSFLVSRNYPINFHLNGTNTAGIVGLVTPTTSDYSLTYDIDGDARPVPRDAGADEFVSGGAAKPGDLNGDGRVDIFDLSILLSNYGTSNSIADINRDGIVDIFDLSTLLSNYGT